MNFSFTQLATYSVIFRYFLRCLLNLNYILVLLRGKPWNKQNLKKNKNKKMLSCGKGSKCLVDKSYFPFTENGRSRLYHMFKFFILIYLRILFVMSVFLIWRTTMAVFQCGSEQCPRAQWSLTKTFSSPWKTQIPSVSGWPIIWR